MRIVFMGSAELACPCLDRLLARPADPVVGVVTQPDRPKGRALQVAPCPVREHVARTGIPVLTPEKINTPASLADLRALAPDLIVVVAYGQILKAPILSLPPQGCINVHASLLPKYRGAAPIQWAIVRGERVTGVTTMYMNEAMDAGDIIAQREEPIREDDTAGTLHDRLARLGADLLTETVEAIHKGTIRRIPQNVVEATLAPKLKKSDGHLDWNRPAAELYNRIRGFNPWPGCFFELPGRGFVRILKAGVETGVGRAGEVLECRGAGPLVQTGDRALRLLEVQPEGRKPMNGAAFLCGHPLAPGLILPGSELCMQPKRTAD